ncbi:MAG TPA: N-acetylmuramoyl-L-alanine amidase [Jiangellaceae bacterium]|nr:N-acetylmuramoyl-L-alanine amidase [Jiangellaceae bacterium]
MTKTRRRALPALGGAALLAVSSLSLAHAHGPAASSSDGTGPGELTSAFEQAAAEYDVPQDVLVALSQTVTRMDHHDGEPSASAGYGLMHLFQNPETDTLATAAELTGSSESELKSDEATNIEGAAAILRAHADALELEAAERDDVNMWYEPLARYSGFADPSIARLEADAVYDYLESGFATEVDGERIGVDSRSVDPELGSFADVSTLDDRLDAQSEDYPPALWVPAHSSNYTSAERPNSHAIDRVVIHTTEGNYAGAISWLQNPESNVSAHYVLRSSDGEVTQMVRHSDIGWHAGNWNYNTRSIGLEHEAFVDDPSWYTEAMYRSSAALTAHIADTYELPKDRDHIIGHNEVPGATHTDPGQYWDWDHYMSLVNGAGDQPDGTPYDVWASAVNVRADSTTDSDVVGNLGDPRTVHVECQQEGEEITHGDVTSNLWARLSSPTEGYISNVFIDGGADGLDVETC